MMAKNSQCAGCKIGRHSVIMIGELYYSADVMWEAWEAGKIKNPAAKILVYGPAAAETEDAQLPLFSPGMIAKAKKPSCCDKVH